MRFARFFSFAVFLMPLACDEENDASVPRGDELCTVVEVMDELCEGWREENRDFAQGCWAASISVAVERYPRSRIGDIWSAFNSAPDPDAPICSERE